MKSLYNKSGDNTGKEQGDINISPLRDKYWDKNLSDEEKFWFEEDKKYFLHQSLSTPVLRVLKKTEGIYIEDLHGKRYIDMHGNGVHNAGFNNPSVVARLKKQLDEQMTFCPRRYTNIPAIQLAKKMAEITPGNLSKSLFSPGGSEAVEMSLQLARHVTGKYKTISFWDSFHGAGFAAASVGGEEHFSGGMGPLVPGNYHVEFPDYYRNPWGLKDKQEIDALYLRQIQVILERDPEIAAIIGEPVSATPQVPTPFYWQEVKKLCEKYGVFLIFDEIIEGFGRTGKMFACEHFVTPDILVLGKSFGGGIVPFAGIVTHEKYDVLQSRSIGHYTHEKNAFCATAGLAEIEYIEENKLVEQSKEVGAYTLNCLLELKDKHPMIGNVAGLGLHMGIDLVLDRKTKERATQQAEEIMFKALERGLAFKTISGNVITLRPSLLISKDEMDTVLAILDEVIGETEQELNY